MIKTRPQKTKTTSQLIKELDDIFSLYVRLNEADAYGTVTCFVTGERVYYRDADAAHFIDRAHMATRWDTENVHACTQETNRYDPDHKKKYRLAMVRKYGAGTVESLEVHSRSLMKRTAHELTETIETFKEEVKKLRALKKI